MEQPPENTHLDRTVVLDLCERTDALFRRFQEMMVREYPEQMQGFSHATGAGATLKWAMPVEMHSWLKGIKPDGVADFTKNTDFMAYLKKAYPWFGKQFPMADRPWEDLATGRSTSTGPRPKPERQQLAKENSVILDEHGNMVKAC